MTNFEKFVTNFSYPDLFFDSDKSVYDSLTKILIDEEINKYFFLVLADRYLKACKKELGVNFTAVEKSFIRRCFIKDKKLGYVIKKITKAREDELKKKSAPKVR